MNMLVVTLVMATGIAKELPDYEEQDVKKVVLVNALK